MLDLGQLHGEPAFADLQHAHPLDLALSLLVPESTEHVFAGRPTQHPLGRGGAARLMLRHRQHRARDRAVRPPITHLHDHRVARAQRGLEIDVRQQERVRPPDGVKLDTDKTGSRRAAHLVAHRSPVSDLER